MVDPRVERTRAAVLAAARQVLLDEGWDAVTHARVAEVSGVGRATMYRHWPEPDALLVEALRSLMPEDHAPRCGDLRQDLLAELDVLRQELNDDRFVRVISTLVERSAWDPAIAELRAELADAGADRVRVILRDARREGALPTRLDLEQAIAQLAGPLAYQRLIAGRRITEAFLAAVVDGFLSARAPAERRT